MKRPSEESPMSQAYEYDRRVSRNAAGKVFPAMIPVNRLMSRAKKKWADYASKATGMPWEASDLRRDTLFDNTILYLHPTEESPVHGRGTSIKIEFSVKDRYAATPSDRYNVTVEASSPRTSTLYARKENVGIEDLANPGPFLDSILTDLSASFAGSTVKEAKSIHEIALSAIEKAKGEIEKANEAIIAATALADLMNGKSSVAPYAGKIMALSQDLYEYGGRDIAKIMERLAR